MHPQLAIIDEQEITITPLFKMLEVENIPKSETAGYAVMEMQEVVEVRFAGTRNYAPIFPAAAMWKREGNQTITYAERWPEQYRAFKEGNPQEAQGTPLQMLGNAVTPEQLSLCRALKIYSIEALARLEGPQIKSLGMHQNILKDAARRFLADRDRGAYAISEVEDLRAELAVLKAMMKIPAQQATPEEIDALTVAADDAYAALSDGQIKDEIAKLNDGKRPQGNPSRGTLISMLDQLKAA